MAPPDAQEPAGTGSLVGPKTFVNILGGGVSLYGRKFKQLAPPYVALGVAMQVALLGLSALLVQTESDVTSSYVFLRTAIQSLLFHLPAALISGLCVIVLLDHVMGVTTSLAEARPRVRPVTAQLLAAGLYAAILSLLGIFLPTFILVVPALLLTLMGPPILVQVIAHERKSLQEALPRARSLWRRQVLRVFLYLFSIGLGMTLLWLVLVLGAQGALISSDLAFSGLGDVLFALGAGALFGLSLPLMITMSTLAYLDLRSRAEEDFSPAVLGRESRRPQ
ncbi:MAG: hypothetical protein M3391_00050 [Actinomycetota bacterium]|nr:hypothetical protein [Actinomycetota bacterium]